MISEEERLGDYTFVVISDDGLNHRLNSVPNQDAVMYVVDDDDYAIAVSDGVGSCSMSDIGSKKAVETIKSIFWGLRNKELEFDQDTIVGSIIETWKTYVDDENIDNYCATLKAGIKIGNRLLLVSIGDGLLAVSSNGLHEMAPYDQDPFLNLTSCLNSNVKKSDFWLSVFKLDTYVPYVLFLCTDGVANGISEGKELELVREIEINIDNSILKEELEKMIIDISDYSSDDRSLGVVKYERDNAESNR